MTIFEKILTTLIEDADLDDDMTEKEISEIVGPILVDTYAIYSGEYLNVRSPFRCWDALDCLDRCEVLERHYQELASVAGLC